jgi:hypothetical protein
MSRQKPEIKMKLDIKEIGRELIELAWDRAK